MALVPPQRFQRNIFVGKLSKRLTTVAPHVILYAVDSNKIQTCIRTS
jgi:hypothetical protein